MRFSASVFLLSATFCTAATAVAQPPEQTQAFEETHGERVYLEGRAVDAVLLPDGSVAYVLERPPAVTRHDGDGPWILVAHPALGPVTRPVDPVTGERIAIGTDPDGTYHGFAWFKENAPNVVESAERTSWIPLYETHPPDLEEWSPERAAPSPGLQGTAVLKWWAAWEEWLENLNAANLVPHSGVVSHCRETDEATVVTMKGDGTFEFLYRNRDRVTYEGLPASSPCDLVGQRVTVWTLPCGDDGPCIRKIRAVDLTGSPRAPTVEAVALTPAKHFGLIDACRPREGATVVTLKGDGTFQFLYRSGDDVVFEGVRARSPCDLIGSQVVVWTADCGEEGPCITRIEARTDP